MIYICYFALVAVHTVSWSQGSSWCYYSREFEIESEFNGLCSFKSMSPAVRTKARTSVLNGRCIMITSEIECRVRNCLERTNTILVWLSNDVVALTSHPCHKLAGKSTTQTQRNGECVTRNNKKLAVLVLFHVHKLSSNSRRNGVTHTSKPIAWTLQSQDCRFGSSRDSLSGTGTVANHLVSVVRSTSGHKSWSRKGNTGSWIATN